MNYSYKRRVHSQNLRLHPISKIARIYSVYYFNGEGGIKASTDINADPNS